MMRIPFQAHALSLALLSSASWPFSIPVASGALRVTASQTADVVVHTPTHRFADSDTAIFVLPPDRSKVQALVNTSGFASALTEATNRNVEVGVGSFQAASTTSTGILELFIHNGSPNAILPIFMFTIAPGQILLTDFSSGGFAPPDGPRGAVSVTIDYSVGNGPLVPAFEYGAALEVIAGMPSIAVVGPASTTFTPSRGRYLLDIHEFESSIRMPEIPADGSFYLIYRMTASGSLGDSPFFGDEWGYRAAIGDPMDLSAGGGGEIVALPSPVPEPAASALFALGVLALGALRAARACPVRRRCPSSPRPVSMLEHPMHPRAGAAVKGA